MTETDQGSARRLRDGAELSDLFRAYPVGERELIAAVVSGTNACGYCCGAHRIIADTFGTDESVIRSAVHDPRMSLVPVHMRPMLRFVEKLTRAPGAGGG